MNDDVWFRKPKVEMPVGLSFTGTTGRSARNNNPLNLEYRPNSYQDKYGAVLEPTGGGKDKKPRFAKFPSMMHGYLAGLEQIRIDQSRGLTLKQFVHKFSPPHENPTDKLVEEYAKAVGAKPDTLLKDIPAERLIIPMMKRESSTRIVGYGPNVANTADKDDVWFKTTGLPALSKPEPSVGLEGVLSKIIEPKAAEAAEAAEGKVEAPGDDVWFRTDEGISDEEKLLSMMPLSAVKDVAKPPPSVMPEPVPEPKPEISLLEEFDIPAEEKLLSALPLSSVSRLSTNEEIKDALKAEIGGSPIYEWLLWAGLSTIAPMGGVKLSQALQLAKLAKAARLTPALEKVIGPKATELLGSLTERAIRGASAGAAFETGRQGLEALDIYHRWGEEGTGLKGIGEEALEWGLFDAALGGIGAIRRGIKAGRQKAASRYVEREAEKIFKEQVGDVSEYTKAPHEYEWILNQIAPYKGPLERLGDATWRKYIAEPLWDALSKVGDIPVPGVEKTLREVFQRGIVRLRKSSPELAKQIDRAQLNKAVLDESFQVMSGAYERLTLAERHQLQTAISEGKLPTEVESEPVREVLTQLQRLSKPLSRKKVDQLFADEFEQVYHEYMVKPLKEVDKELGRIVSPSEQDIVLRKYLTKYSEGLEGASPAKIRQSFYDLLADPMAPEPIKKYAQHLINLPAFSPEMVHKSTTKAVTQAVAAVVKKDKNAVSAVPKEGFVKSKHPEFADLYVLKDVELEMEALKYMGDEANKFYRKYFLPTWKTNKVVLRPSAHFRNMFSNLVLNDIGGLPFYRVDIYKQALSEMRSNTARFKKFAQDIAATGRMAFEDLHRYVKPISTEDNMLDVFMRYYDKVAAVPRVLYGAEETWFKYAKYLHNLNKGMAHDSALLDAVKWTFNYGEITPAVKMIRQSPFGMPFFTWLSKAVPLYVETQVKYPLRWGKWWAMLYGIHQLGLQNAGMTSDEWNRLRQAMPEYIKNGLWLCMPWRDDQGRLKLLNLTWMLPGLGDLAELYGRGEPSIFGLFLQSPILSMTSSLLTGKTELGIPVWYEWESPVNKAAKGLTHIWQWWAPAWAPAGIDWNMVWDAMQGRPEALSPTEALAAQFGFRLKSISPELQLRRAEALRKMHIGEARTSMYRELRNAASDRERQQIIEKYARILRDVGSEHEDED